MNRETRSFLMLRLSSKTILSDRESESEERPWKGYDPRASLNELCEVNSKEWRLGERARHQDAAMFVYNNRVVAMMTIDKIVKSNSGRRYSIIGHPLRIGDPLYAKYVGKHVPSENISRNPVSYYVENNEDDLLIKIRSLAKDVGGSQNLIKRIKELLDKGLIS